MAAQTPAARTSRASRRPLLALLLATLACTAGTASAATGPVGGLRGQTAPQPPQPADLCSALNGEGCGVCTQAQGCGWCPSSGTCITASNGTCHATAANGGLITTGADCVCGSISQSLGACNVCVDNGQCGGLGWCAPTHTCAYGTATGPFNTTCGKLPADWVTTVANCTCATTNPSTLTTCFSCTSVCAGWFEWCPAFDECILAGSACPTNPVSGPAVTSAGNCMSNSTQFDTCESCLTAFPGLGWCTTDSTCFYGDASGPDNSTCDHWVDSLSGCACGSLDPSTLTSCESCLGSCQGSFDWCPSTNTCYSVNDTSVACPSTALHGPAISHLSQCLANSTVFSTCSECLNGEYNDLGWCATSSTCYYGNSQGPFGMKCRDWVTSSESCACASLDPSTLTTCADCTAVCPGQFEWCASAGQCQVPSVAHPCPYTALHGPPVTNPQYCLVNSTVLTSCDSCLSERIPQLGWCGSSSTCWYGSSHGPYGSTSCNSGWTTDMSQCMCSAAPVNSTCQSCLSECPGAFEWCPSTTTCLLANSTQTGLATCPVTASAGPVVTSLSNCYGNVSSLSTCEACTGAGFTGLGWCADSNTCEYGDSWAPYTGSCNNWVTNTTGCLCAQAQPSTFDSCESCTSMCPGLFGWCPSTGKCTWANETAACQATALNGTFTTSAMQCHCTQPSLFLGSCELCTSGCPHNGWCPGTGMCLHTANGVAPMSDATCEPDTIMGSFKTDCSCEPPGFYGNITDCLHACPSAANYTWCSVEGACRARTPALPDPCPSVTCLPNCLCLPGESSGCTACKMGYSDPSSGCKTPCSSNCKDCDPKNPNVCLTQCAPGHTGFPNCTEPCASPCKSCGGAWKNSKLTSKQCTICADPGARPPECTTCIPYVCHMSSTNLTCALPCHAPSGSQPIGVAFVADTDDTSDGPAYPNCDGCVDGAGKILDMGEIGMELFASMEQAETYELLMDATCLVIPPPFDLMCGFAVAGLTGGGLAVATAFATHEYNEAGAHLTCMVNGQCRD